MDKEEVCDIIYYTANGRIVKKQSIKTSIGTNILKVGGSKPLPKGVIFVIIKVRNEIKAVIKVYKS